MNRNEETYMEKRIVVEVRIGRETKIGVGAERKIRDDFWREN